MHHSPLSGVILAVLQCRIMYVMLSDEWVAAWLACLVVHCILTGYDVVKIDC